MHAINAAPCSSFLIAITFVAGAEAAGRQRVSRTLQGRTSLHRRMGRMRQAHGPVDCCGLSDNAIVAGARSRNCKKMKLSTERILTTHVGSLPRPDDLFEL
ncbi:MAG TPA: hypothetical protein VK749_22350, partial [Xanthobacteraceae bacterium]|nr:hypothetical protein [Xanthobacteraceae bacterium]